MSNLAKVIADFDTTLNLKVAIGATTATLDSATDDDGIALPTGTYLLTVDGDNSSSKEYYTCTLTGTALTAIQSFSRQGALTSGFVRSHRKGARVTITDWGILKKVVDLLDGTVAGDEMVFKDLTFSGTTTSGLKVKSLTTAQRDASSNAANGQIIYNSTTGELNQYIGGAWSAVAAGSTQADASTTVAGKVEIATSAETIAGTDTGGTGAKLLALPSDQAKNIQSGTFVYGTDVGGDDTYVVALTPTLAAYTAGQTLYFKPTTANTGACSVDFGPSVLNIKTKDGNDPQSGVLRALTEVSGHYDGTNFVLDNEDFATTSNKGIAEMATDAEATAGTDTSRYTNPSQLPKYGNGIITRAFATASGAVTTAHGLGRVPKLGFFHAKFAKTGLTIASSDGSYNGTTNANSALLYNSNGSVNTVSGDTTNAVSITWGSSAADSQVAVVTWDATNITLTWTKVGTTTTGDIQITYELIA